MARPIILLSVFNIIGCIVNDVLCRYYVAAGVGVTVWYLLFMVFALSADFGCVPVMCARFVISVWITVMLL